MKKIISALIVITILLAFAGCSNSSKPEITAESTEQQSELKNDASKANYADKKILVAYFTYGENADFPDDIDASASASIQMLNDKITGNTGLVANYIAKATGADVFSIITKEKYPSDYDETVEIGQQEKKNNTKPEIDNHIENFDAYDTIFVGFPNWWYGMPMVMQSFFDEYDFAGKTIIPFCTSGGSAFSDSINEMKSLEPNANVIEEGLHIGASSASSAESQVQEWIEELNIG